MSKCLCVCVCARVRVRVHVCVCVRVVRVRVCVRIIETDNESVWKWDKYLCDFVDVDESLRDRIKEREKKKVKVCVCVCVCVCEEAWKKERVWKKRAVTKKTNLIDRIGHWKEIILVPNKWFNCFSSQQMIQLFKFPTKDSIILVPNISFDYVRS